MSELEPLPARPGYRVVKIGYVTAGSAVPVALHAYVPAPPAGQAEATDKRHFSRVRFLSHNVSEGHSVFIAWRDEGLPGANYNGTDTTNYRAGQVADLPSYEAESLAWCGVADIIIDYSKGQ